MPLTVLDCQLTNVTDLSALKGMPLAHLECDHTNVSDLSPLQGMNLTTAIFSPGRITTGIDSIRQMKSLTSIGTSGRNEDKFPPEEFWKKYDAGELGKPITTLSDPAFKQWMKDVAGLRAEDQVGAVVARLKLLNPHFDGTEQHKIEFGVVTELQIHTHEVTDLSPVRALVGLKKLNCAHNGEGPGKLSDLSPLQGMPLSELVFDGTEVWDLSPLHGMPLTKLAIANGPLRDLSPLKGMPLTALDFHNCPVCDLSPLNGMPLTHLDCGLTAVFDLSPLKGMPLKQLHCGRTYVSDLSPIKGMRLTRLSIGGAPITDLTPLREMNLHEIFLTPKNITKGIDAIRQMKSVEFIGTWDANSKLPPDEFWKKYDAGEFNK
jgi:Leucine-rich repeat (LRR) protein